MFNFRTKFSAVDAHTYPSWNKKNIFDMFIFHSIWNYKEVKKLVPKGKEFLYLYTANIYSGNMDTSI